MSEKSLRSKIIRLAYQNPSLRKDLLSLVKVSAEDYSGNYDSTLDFVETHDLMDLAKKVFGKGWNNSGDYDDDTTEIKRLLKELKSKHKVIYVENSRQNRDNFEDAKSKYKSKMKNRSNTGDIFVIR